MIDFLFGLWNGWTCVAVFILHLFGWIWPDLWTLPLYDQARDISIWYQLGFILGIGGISGSCGAGCRR